MNNNAMRHPVSFAVLILMCGVLFVGSVSVDELKKKIERFDQVAGGVYRGGQPDEAGLDTLKNAGFKTIVSVRHEKDVNRWEQAEVEKRGMTFVHIPWTIYGSYDRTVFQRFFDVVDNEQNQPVFVHCKRGSERTGVLAALYKMKHEGLTREQAFAYTEGYDVKLIWRPFVREKINKFCDDQEKRS